MKNYWAKIKHWFWKNLWKSKKIIESKINKDGTIEDTIEVKAEAIPDWWNSECHCLKEKKHDMFGTTFGKYCVKCREYISEKGCKHNL